MKREYWEIVVEAARAEKERDEQARHSTAERNRAYQLQLEDLEENVRALFADWDSQTAAAGGLQAWFPPGSRGREVIRALKQLESFRGGGISGKQGS